MIKLPKKVTIFGDEYKVLIEDLGEGVAGVIVTDKKIIIIDKKQNIKDAKESLAHELGHGLFNRISLDQASIPDEIEEIIVDAFAKMYCEVFDLRLRWK